MKRDGEKLVDCIIGVGSNIQPEENIPLALSLLGEAVEVVTISQIWETKAVGTKGPNFLNAAVQIRTHLAEDEIKHQVLRKIEAKLGRVRKADKYAPRPIDLDVILYDGQVIDPALWTQVHIAVPVSELVPKFMNSTTGETLNKIAKQLRDQMWVKLRTDIAL